MDTVSPKTRSRIMSQVRSSGNRSTELRMIQVLKGAKISGWRRGYPLPGKPDFVFPKQRLAVFVDGCFWHGCRRHCRLPNSKRRYWVAKIEGNKRRDKEIKRLLRKAGWKVLRIWEHELYSKTIAKKIGKIRAG